MPSITPCPCLLNWKHFAGNLPGNGAAEFRLYTDATFYGECSIGPYYFINTIAHAGPNVMSTRAAAVLRTDYHFPKTPDFGELKPNNEHYHGGDISDEMAALASLLMGVRLKAGPADRWFDPAGEARGRPQAYGGKPVPQIPLQYRLPQLPLLSEAPNLASLSHLSTILELPIEAANTLIKAARQYQEAIWIADADPNLAWILLVAAIETAAGYQAKKSPPTEEIFSSSFPDLAALIREKCADILSDVARLLARYTKATARFVQFIENYAPSPPPQRPSEFLQFDYSPQNLRAAMSTIYNARSRALHDGTAFPAPMCDPPRMVTQDDRVPPEKPFALGSSTGNATWIASETPMLLHTFEYIARNTLHTWWTDLIGNAKNQTPGDT